MIAQEDKGFSNNKETVKYLDKHLKKSLLRFITCGSVDDGKSTLLGRLLLRLKLYLQINFLSYKQTVKSLEHKVTH